MICQLWDNEEAVKLGIPYEDCALFYSWNGVVFFSAARFGNMISCHIAANSKGKRQLRVAVNMFCQYMLNTFNNCDAIIAHVSNEKQSVKNLVLKCGFKKIGEIENLSEVYSLCR